MDSQGLQFIIQALLEIFANHVASTGRPPTLEEATALLKKDLDRGQSPIALWFAEKGLALPE